MKLTSLTLAFASLSLIGYGQAAAPAQPRMLCLYVDLNALSPADLAKAQDAAVKFIEMQATPADQITVMTYNSRINVLTDFTNDHVKLVGVLRGIMPGQVGAPDDVSAHLQGIRAAADLLGALPQKKAMIYFSSGVLRTADAQPGMSATVDSLMRANVSLYPVDARGLVPAPR
jgi:VWFA-related protein